MRAAAAQRRGASAPAELRAVRIQPAEPPPKAPPDEGIMALVEAMEAVMERRHCAVIQLDRQGRIAYVAAVAAELLEAYCGWRSGPRLPLSIEAWRRSQAATLNIDGQRGRLRLRMLAAGQWPAIVLEEQRSSLPDGPPLQELGLTAREVQVLRLLACGKRNEEIAHELTISGQTVRKHLEHVYAKLGVSSRAQAIARVLG